MSHLQGIVTFTIEHVQKYIQPQTTAFTSLLKTKKINRGFELTFNINHCMSLRFGSWLCCMGGIKNSSGLLFLVIFFHVHFTQFDMVVLPLN